MFCFFLYRVRNLKKKNLMIIIEFFRKTQDKNHKIYLNHSYINKVNNYTNISKEEKYNINLINNSNETKNSKYLLSNIYIF